MVNITLKDGSVKEIKSESTVYQLAESLSKRLAKEAVGGKVDGVLVGLNAKLTENCQVEILTFDDEEGEEIYRHTSSHILAHAVKRLYDQVKLGIGPPIKDGFYYDFDLEHSLSDNDLYKIKDEMNMIIEEDLPIERQIYERDEAIKLFKEMGEEYKIELIEDLEEGEQITCYRQGDFIDLCQGPHLPSTGKVKASAIDLLKVAGAYWRGDEDRQMLQRIYGTSFVKKSQLEDYLQKLEEAKKRDHRKIGRELELFTLHEEGPGFPFYHNNGMIIMNELINFWRKEHRKAGYQEISTPIILNRSLWERSGHWDHYQENMYFTEIDDEDFAIKPMNCPGAMLVYKNSMYSYRDFPLRIGELGLVHRHELSGALHGLLRVRSFTQDDAHIFMLPSQVEQELEKVIELIDRFYQVFGFNYYVELSTKPEKAMGSDQIWEKAINALQVVLEKRGINYVINEGDGAFYGPKIDFQLEDAIGRSWQCGTIQLDFQLPERFDLTYIGEDGQKHRPVMIHRVAYGALERFFALLIEHYEGKFPLWLAPKQAVIIPITDRHIDYGQKILQKLEDEGIRAHLDDRNEKIGYKIRDNQLKKVPYMLIVGDEEVDQNTLSVRTREDGDLGAKSAEEVVKELKKEIANS